MHLINNQPTIDFAPYINVDSLLELKPYLDYAVVKSSRLATPSRYLESQFLDKKYRGIKDLMNDQFDYDFIQDLKDHDQFAAWLRYHQDLAYGQQSVPIIYSNDWSTKHLSDKVFKTENVKYWETFFNWLKSQNIFDDYGRVAIFLNEPGVSTPAHLDSSDASRRDEFIWMSLDRRKKMFVYDLETKQKHYLNTVIGTFDATNYHGADPGELASWSLRIDGVFSDDFLNRTNLKNHYRP